MKVLLLDTNVSSYPIYKALIGFGYDVFVAGNNPDDCLAGICDNYISVNYSSIKNIQKIQEREEFDAIIPGCNDVSYKTAAALNALNNFGLNLDDPSINDRINEKDQFKQLAISIGLPVANPLLKDEVKHNTEKKIIVKPVDSYSGKGITVLYKANIDELNKALEYAKTNSSKKEYLIEEFFEGQLYSHSAFIKNGKIELDFIVEEHCIYNPFRVDTSWVIPESDFKHIERIRSEINKLAAHLKLCDGLIHTQFIAKEDDFRIIEITRRCPGDSYSLLIEHTTGFGYAQYYVSKILKTLSNQTHPNGFKNIFRHTIHSEKPFFISYRPSFKFELIEFIPHEKTGQDISKLRETRVGVIFGELSNSKKQDLKIKGTFENLKNDGYSI